MRGVMVESRDGEIGSEWLEWSDAAIRGTLCCTVRLDGGVVPTGVRVVGRKGTRSNRGVGT
jgi:hypothetical protein